MSESAVATRTKRVLTGYRPTGPLHVGHWAGNVETMLALQADPAYSCFFFIADWHMLTTHYDRTDELSGFVEGLVLDWLAAGLDPERAVIYRQSRPARGGRDGAAVRDDDAARVARACAVVQGAAARYGRA